ncbi:MAG: hypothetical protein LBT09_08850 [Planctomycetaceae bacterium]|nr:hypothetical protein [Planctomycetaceae bacterium]
MKENKKKNLFRRLIIYLLLMIFAISSLTLLLFFVIEICTFTGIMGYQPRNRFIAFVDPILPWRANTKLTFHSANNFVSLAMYNVGLSPYSVVLCIPVYVYDKQQKTFVLQNIGDYGLVNKQDSSSLKETKERIRNFRKELHLHYNRNDNNTHYGYAGIGLSNYGDKVAVYPAARFINREFISIINMETMKPESEIPLPFSAFFDHDINEEPLIELKEKQLDIIFFDEDAKLAILYCNRILLFDLIRNQLINTIQMPKELVCISNLAYDKESIYCVFRNNNSNHLECYRIQNNTVKLESPFWSMPCKELSSVVRAVLLPSKNKLVVLNISNRSRNSLDNSRLSVYDLLSDKCIYECVLSCDYCCYIAISQDVNKIAISGVRSNKLQKDHVCVIDIDRKKFFSIYDPNKTFGKGKMFFADNDILFIQNGSRITVWNCVN